jgi:hypothetical protein
MFEEFDKTLRAKLIFLYESFIKNPREKNLRENAATITQRYANSGDYNLHREVSFALGKAYDLELGKLSVEEAKKILKDLQKPK